LLEFDTCKLNVEGEYLVWSRSMKILMSAFTFRSYTTIDCRAPKERASARDRLQSQRHNGNYFTFESCWKDFEGKGVVNANFENFTFLIIYLFITLWLSPLLRDYAWENVQREWCVDYYFQFKVSSSHVKAYTSDISILLSETRALLLFLIFQFNSFSLHLDFEFQTINVWKADILWYA
jgi:hypothetical protein